MDGAENEKAGPDALAIGTAIASENDQPADASLAGFTMQVKETEASVPGTDLEMKDISLSNASVDESLLLDNGSNIDINASSICKESDIESCERVGGEVLKENVEAGERPESAADSSIEMIDSPIAAHSFGDPGNDDCVKVSSNKEFGVEDVDEKDVKEDMDTHDQNDISEADSSIEVIASPGLVQSPTKELSNEDLRIINVKDGNDAKVDDCVTENSREELVIENVDKANLENDESEADSSVELISSPVAVQSPTAESSNEELNIKDVNIGDDAINKGEITIESDDSSIELIGTLVATASTDNVVGDDIPIMSSKGISRENVDVIDDMVGEITAGEANANNCALLEQAKKSEIDADSEITTSERDAVEKDDPSGVTQFESDAIQDKEEKINLITDVNTTIEDTPLNTDVEPGNNTSDDNFKVTVVPVDVQEQSEVVEHLAAQNCAQSDGILSKKVEPMDIDEVACASTNDEVLFVELKKDENQLPEQNTEQPNELTTDSEVYYNKECLNCNCKKEHKQFLLASVAALNYFKVPRKTYKRQYICLGCCDMVQEIYEKYAGILVAKAPLLLHEFKHEHAEFVALDSSDEEDDEIKPEDPELSKNDLKLVETELEDIIKSVLDKVEIQNQLTWSKTILQIKTDRLERQFQSIDTELSNLQNVADKMHFALYNSCQVEHKHMPPIDLYHQSGIDYAHVPPAGEIERPPITLNKTYYAVKTKAIASWVPAKVIEFSESTAVGGNMIKNYKIRYLNTTYQMVKTVTARHIAYYEPPAVRLTIGTRVIAYFDGSTLSRGKDKNIVQSAFYPGIIAEPLKQANRFRYLIFYDDGYTTYVQHKDVRLVCQASEKVWEDVHYASRDFIQKYVEKYSVDRPMVQCTRGQNMNTESNGTWLYARVIDIDCSLVLMQFEGDKNHTEWIYRGSLRLGPVFKETQNALNRASSIQYQQRVPRRTEPFIRYTKEMEVSNMQVKQQMRAIARKSSSLPQNVAMPASASIVSASSSSAAAAAAAASRNTVRHLNNSTIYVDDENRPKGHVVYFTAKRNLPPKMYAQHECTPSCLFKIVHRLDSYSPLAKPLLSGWERLVVKQKIKRSVVYRGPCGKSLRNLAEVHKYLRATDNVLNVENFDFTPDLHCLAEYSIDPTIVKEADISKGQEKMAIPLVNYYDNTLPPPCTYAKQRIPTDGVDLNLDEEFLVGCDCEDDCSDKSKCSCWQLTVEGAKYYNPTKPIDEIGYQYKRLHEHVPTGIYECNSRCKCKKNCLNRVVQHSLEMKLQVFKTSNRGWGLRCVNDIPKGAFICIYAGHLLTETRANEGGLDAGDEYFADLDYIEVAEQLKEGFESDVEHSEQEEEEDTYVPDAEEDDDDFTIKKHYNPRNKNKVRASRSNSSQGGEVDSQERAVINFNPNADLDETVRENSVRRLFGKDEAPYIMDAKTTGNLGRYFNHSCSPNLFVQNVFVDTHDLRFPWVAFFSANHIRSGTELTWNYNYEVGVVPGKVLYCQCGSSNCRIRLL